jgi:hypothetical protein
MMVDGWIMYVHVRTLSTSPRTCTLFTDDRSIAGWIAPFAAFCNLAWPFLFFSFLFFSLKVTRHNGLVLCISLGLFEWKWPDVLAWSPSDHHGITLQSTPPSLSLHTWVGMANKFSARSDSIPVGNAARQSPSPQEINIWPGSSLPGIHHLVCTRTVQAPARWHSRSRGELDQAPHAMTHVPLPPNASYSATVRSCCGAVLHACPCKAAVLLCVLCRLLEPSAASQVFRVRLHIPGS